MSADPIPLTVPIDSGMTPEQQKLEQIRVLLVHAGHQASQIAEVTMGQTEVLRSVRDLAGKMDRHIVDSAERMARVEQELSVNTAATQIVRDTVTAGRVATNLIKWIGGVAAAVAGVWMLVAAFMRGDHGIGP